MTLELAVRPNMTLSIDGTEYTLEFPLVAVVKAEEKIGRSLKSPADWFTAPAKDIPALLEAGLALYGDRSPGIVAAICERLDPESYAELAEALGALAFPRFTARYKDALDKARAGTPKEPGGDL